MEWCEQPVAGVITALIYTEYLLSPILPKASKQASTLRSKPSYSRPRQTTTNLPVLWQPDAVHLACSVCHCGVRGLPLLQIAPGPALDEHTVLYRPELGRGVVQKGNLAATARAPASVTHACCADEVIPTITTRSCTQASYTISSHMRFPCPSGSGSHLEPAVHPQQHVDAAGQPPLTHILGGAITAIHLQGMIND